MTIKTLYGNPLRFNTRTFFLVALLLIGCSAFANDGDHHEEDARFIELSPQALKNITFSTEVAGAGEVDRKLILYGQLLPEPTAVSHIRARYPGVVSQVNVHIGDEVKKDQRLASIHSNESMREYPLRAPFAGMVIAKHAGPGEFVSDQVLFEMADYSQLWAELQVFSARISSVRPGQSVEILSGEASFSGKLRSVVPAGKGLPFARARVLINNADRRWTPGVFVEGHVQLARKNVAIAVDNRALQDLDGNTVVFVQAGPGRFEAKTVRLGERGSAFSEVLSGLKPGQQYAVENSYLLKAELEKSAAGHGH
ncbi:efflux RND transporter periplasmic adaptor subunit [Microbulbifer sp. CAU 1566]|uniref:efflux RND transporter periplasmic adaptor subunit n=1 Tax=Microbulbifer sp. CAU 1566 TaxID=2933269 RepID=UPI0020060D7D|nr:efflux RND transporter periplasmic adaptor subunit [Microbulbifer sp. CAU 1566]MCK7598555.1 efflux RND transporter periplasmic adaptor subunit [Microbulbifer sp. CAU 1566]